MFVYVCSVNVDLIFFLILLHERNVSAGNVINLVLVNKYYFNFTVVHTLEVIQNDDDDHHHHRRRRRQAVFV